MKIFIVSMLFLAILSASAASVSPVIENARKAAVVAYLSKDIAKIVMDYACVQVVRERGGEEHILSFDYDNGLMVKRKGLPWYNVVSPGQYLHSQVIVDMIQSAMVGVIAAKEKDKVYIRAYILADPRPIRGAVLVDKEYLCEEFGDLRNLVMDSPVMALVPGSSEKAQAGVQFERSFLRCDFLSWDSLVHALISHCKKVGEQPEPARFCVVQ